VLIRDGRITAVGRNIAIPEGAQRIDATGKWVTPGLINANTQLGLIEIGQVADTRNSSARGSGDAINAAFTVWDGLNPTSVLLSQTRADGVTSVGILPTGGLIAGQAAVVDLVEGGVTDMLVRQPVAMVGQVGRTNAANTNARGELLVRLRELLEDTRVYARRRAEFERAETRPFAASRIDLEAMIPVVEGRLPFIVGADKASDIEAVLELARRYGLKVIVQGGAEAWMVAPKLAAAKVPVMAGAMNNLPGDFATLGQRQENVAILRRAGVTVLLIGNGPGDEESFNVRNVRQEAGNAVAYGMSWDDALRAVTLVPAEVLGVADRIGALAVGREGNVVVWSGDPFELSTSPEHVFVRGRKITTPTREELLTDRYKRLPPDYRTP
jgi:imidazolonepropionase-like amidohydrolase